MTFFEWWLETYFSKEFLEANKRQYNYNEVKK